MVFSKANIPYPAYRLLQKTTQLKTRFYLFWGIGFHPCAKYSIGNGELFNSLPGYFPEYAALVLFGSTEMRGAGNKSLFSSGVKRPGESYGNPAGQTGGSAKLAKLAKKTV